MRVRGAALGVLSLFTLFAAGPTSAQTAYRLKGTTRTGETPLAATMSAEATVVFRGGQFAGQKADEHPSIEAAAPLVVEDRALEAVQSRAAALLPDTRPATQCAAGQMALAIDHTGLAQQLFLTRAVNKSCFEPAAL